jgi:hypothetical protein
VFVFKTKIKEMKSLKAFMLLVGVCFVTLIHAQPPRGIHWSADGNSYYEIAAEGIAKFQMPSFTKTIVATTQQLTPERFVAGFKSAQFFLF